MGGHAKHAQIGADILSGDDSKLMLMAKEIALSHHEWCDGSGYSNGLKGEEIQISGRINALADVFEALLSSRPYKKPWQLNTVVDFIKDHSGTHFDPALVKHFINNLDEFVEVRKKTR